MMNLFCISAVGRWHRPGPKLTMIVDFTMAQIQWLLRCVRSEEEIYHEVIQITSEGDL